MEYGEGICLSCPAHLLDHPDVRIEWNIDYCRDVVRDAETNTWHEGERREASRTASEAFLRGCKTCQTVLSACTCGANRVESEVLLYSYAKLTPMYRRFFPKPPGWKPWLPGAWI